MSPSSLEEHDAIHSALLSRQLPKEEIATLAARHKELTAGEPLHRSVITTKAPEVTRLGVGAYMPWPGHERRSAKIAIDILRRCVPNMSVYSDPVCGSGTIPYLLRRSGRVNKTITNDISYLSVCGQRAFLTDTPLPQRDILSYPRARGLLSKSKACQFPKATAEHIDGFFAMHADNPLALLAGGLALSSVSTFRGMCLMPSQMQSTTPDDWNDTVRAKWRTVSKTPRASGAGTVVHGDCFDFVRSLDVDEVDVIGPDFADPWASGNVAKEYLVMHWLGQVIEQRPRPHPGIWSHAEAPSKIIEFARLALEKAPFFFLRSLNKRWPPQTDIAAFLTRNGVRIVDAITADIVHGGPAKGLAPTYRKVFFLCGR